MCESDFYDSVMLQDRWRKARKEQRCFACQETIRQGDRYHVVVQKNDGVLDHFKHCARCWEVFNAILDAGAESAQWDLNCGVSWEEEFGPIPDEVARLAFLTADEAQAEIADRPSHFVLGTP